MRVQPLFRRLLTWCDRFIRNFIVSFCQRFKWVWKLLGIESGLQLSWEAEHYSWTDNHLLVALLFRIVEVAIGQLIEHLSQLVLQSNVNQQSFFAVSPVGFCSFFLTLQSELFFTLLATSSLLFSQLFKKLFKAFFVNFFSFLFWIAHVDLSGSGTLKVS